MYICLVRDDLWTTGERPEEAKAAMQRKTDLSKVSWEVWEMEEGQTDPTYSPRKYGQPTIKIGQFVRKVAGERVFSD